MINDNLLAKLCSTPLPDTEIVAVTAVEDGTVTPEDGTPLTDLPRLIRVQLIHRPGPRSHIRTEVWLPEDWNGRFVGLGNGGIGGHLSPAALAEMSRQHFACAHTDIGTSAGILCGFNNDDAKMDYGWRATHWMTVCGKALVQACYGKAPAYSYFMGSSTGGKQGYTEAQRYPEDYDGIYAGVPSIFNTVLHSDGLWNFVVLHNADGTPKFTHDEVVRLTLLAASFFQECGDGEPGDNFVTEPFRGPDTVDCFLAYLKKHAPEFTKDQLDTLRKVYEGPVDNRTGEQVSCGLPIGSELGMENFCRPVYSGIYPFLWLYGPDFDPRKFDYAENFDTFYEKMGLYIDAVDPDLRPFRDHGSKLLAFSGTADAIVMYPELSLYYERVSELVGGPAECQKFFRYFRLPGRSHGSGIGADRISSPGTNGHNAFDALIRWVEEGVAPDTLDAVSSDDPGIPGKKPFVRTIYPYGTKEFPFREQPKTFGNRKR